MTTGEVLDIAGLSLKVAAASSALIFVPGVAVAWWLARGGGLARRIVESLILLPAVLPPVAVGLVLLHLLSRRSPVGAAWESVFGEPILLSWPAAAAAAAVMSFPLLVLGARQGFLAVPRRLELAATTLGAGRMRVFLEVTLPLARRGILSGVIYAFLRGLGEFGATTLVAGHIPGRTETLSLAIYDRIRNFEDGEAFVLAGVSAVIALASIVAAARLAPSRERP